MSETTLDKLKHSLDIRYYKSRILLFAIVYIFLTIVSSIDVFFLCILDEDNDILFQLMMVIISLACIFIPIMIGYYIKIIYVLSNFNRYRFYEVMLKEMVPCSDRMAYFVLEIYQENERIEICTKSIFSLTSWLGTPIDECINKKAVIAFDDCNDRVVVINIVDDIKLITNDKRYL